MAAVAYVLKNSQYGLNWHDVYVIVNKFGFTDTPMNDNRLTGDSRQFSDSKYAFQSSVTVGGSFYKHISYYENECSEDMIESILTDASKYLKKVEETADLRTYHRDHFKHIDYYVLRHTIRFFGEDYGIAWDGANRVDNFYQSGQMVTRVRNEERVLSMLEDHASGLTKKEVSLNLHRSHHMLAAVLLGRLIDEGKVMKKTPTHYVTTEKGLDIFKGKHDHIKLIFNDIFNQEAKSSYIIEADYLKEAVNNQLGTHYNKASIVSLAQYWSIKGVLNVNFNRQLFSRTELKYRSMRSLIAEECNPEWELWQAIEKLSQIVWTTDKEYRKSWHAYKAHYQS